MPPSLTQRLLELQTVQPSTWFETGIKARPNLHGLLRYPAMMVPSMQGDIIDAVVGVADQPCHVIDPFVGSGTVMTEALLRGIDFTGIDINPLAVLVCEAKAAIDRGINVAGAANEVIHAIRFDTDEDVDVEFPGLAKWFAPQAASQLSKVRRAIIAVSDQELRKVLWTAFAETIRQTSNSRTSTYKLHIRAEGSHVPADRIIEVFENCLKATVASVTSYRRLIADRVRAPISHLYCGDIRSVSFSGPTKGHTVIVTSPPYGDNQTTIPYGQFSYLALQWICPVDLKLGGDKLTSNTHSLDSASLGGSLKDAELRAERISGVSPAFDRLAKQHRMESVSPSARKVWSFIADFFDAIQHVHDQTHTSAHWVITTGNRTAGGMQIPFDTICKEMLSYFGGSPVAAVRRKLPSKRMPSKNSMGDMITTETTLVVEFKR
jgi:hypothetical protein